VSVTSSDIIVRNSEYSGGMYGWDFRSSVLFILHDRRERIDAIRARGESAIHLVVRVSQRIELFEEIRKCESWKQDDG